jgi:cytochrome c-type biogenesis protein CcmF
LGITVAITAILTVVVNLWLQIEAIPYFILMVVGIFGVVTNIDYFVGFNKIQWKNSASLMSHLGFSIMLIGIIASGVNKRHISKNEFVFKDIMKDENLNKKVTLLKGKPIFMNGYWVNYTGDTLINNERTYDISFTKVDSNNLILEEFSIQPMSVYSNDKTEIVAFNPSTKHYLHKDIFTHIAGLPAQLMKLEYSKEMEDTLNYRDIPLSANIPYENDSIRIVLESIDYEPTHPDYEPKENDLAVGFNMRVIDKIGEKEFTAKPVSVLRGAIVYKYYEEINDLNSRIRVNETFFERFFTLEGEVDYKEVVLREGQSTQLDGLTIAHKGFNKEPENKGYSKKEDDIAIASKLTISGDGFSNDLEPVYLIRGSRQSSIKDYNAASGVHAKFTNIDPATGDLTFEIARDERMNLVIPVEIASNVPRSDLIVIESIEFPGINLFWLGSIMMLIGMLVGMGIRMAYSKEAA